FGCGLCLGCTVLFRYDVGFYAFAALNLVAAAYVLSRPFSLNARLTDLLRVLLPCWLGLAVACVPLAVAFAAGGVMQDFFFDVLYFPAHFYARMRGLPFPGPRTMLRSPKQIGIYLPVVIWVAALVAVFFARRAKNPGAEATPRLWIMLMLGMLSAFFYLKGVVRVDMAQMALSILPALMLSSTLLPYLGRNTRY